MITPLGMHIISLILHKFCNATCKKTLRPRSDNANGLDPPYCLCCFALNLPDGTQNIVPSGFFTERRTHMNKLFTVIFYSLLTVSAHAGVMPETASKARTATENIVASAPETSSGLDQLLQFIFSVAFLIL